MLSAWAESQLRDLDYHWGTAYNISVVDDTWTARFMGSKLAQLLEAEHPDLLRQMIRSDYSSRQDAEQAKRQMT